MFQLFWMDQSKYFFYIRNRQSYILDKFIFTNGFKNQVFDKLIIPNSDVNCFVALTENMAMIQPLFTSSKWNMGEILSFLA